MYVHICESPGLNFLSDSSHYQEALKVSADFFHSVPAVSVPVAFEHCLRDLFSPSHILLASPLIRATVAGNSSVTPFSGWLHLASRAFIISTGASQTSPLIFGVRSWQQPSGQMYYSSWKCGEVNVLWDKLLPVVTGIDTMYLILPWKLPSKVKPSGMQQ